MAYYALFIGFALLGIAALLAAIVGYRGEVCDRFKGYEVPARVQRDPELRKKSNDLVAFWCTGVAVLSVPPLVPIYRVIRSGTGDVSLWVLAALAAYGLVLGFMSSYPFDKIKKYGEDPD
jgi:hypothetical protein